MPVEFACHRLSEEEYRNRRDQTTKEELSKLFLSKEYQRWTRAATSDFFPYTWLLVTGSIPLVAFLVVHSVSLKRPAELQKLLVEKSPPEGVLVTEQFREYPEYMTMGQICEAEAGDRTVGFSSAGMAMNGTVPINDHGIPLIWNSFALLIIFSLLWICLHGRFTISKLEKRLKEKAAKLEECKFQLETAEQSIAILEKELQRKLTQESVMDSSMKTKTREPMGEDGSHEVLIQAKAETSPTRKLDFSASNSEEFVEHFLAERDAMAVERKQIESWLEMEREVKHLRKYTVMLDQVIDNAEINGRIHLENLQGSKLEAKTTPSALSCEAESDAVSIDD